MDSDGLIKLQKSGLLSALIERFTCLIPRAVYRETVTRGKKELYEDAFELEEVIEKNIECIKAKKTEDSERILGSNNVTSLGKGEKQALRLYFQESGEAVISDDRTFLNLLDQTNREAESEDVPFMTPTNVVVAMANKGIISVNEAKKGMEEIKGLIREISYQKALEELQRGGDEDA